MQPPRPDSQAEPSTPLPPRCVACDYDLSGVPAVPNSPEAEVRCPECATNTRPGEYEAAAAARSLKSMLRKSLPFSLVPVALSTLAFGIIQVAWKYDNPDWRTFAVSFLTPTLTCGGFLGFIVAACFAIGGPFTYLQYCNATWPAAPTRRPRLRWRACLASLICTAATATAVGVMLFALNRLVRLMS